MTTNAVSLPTTQCRSPEEFLRVLVTLGGIDARIARAKAVRAPGGMVYRIPDDALRRILELQDELDKAIRECPLIVTKQQIVAKQRTSKRREPKLTLIQGGKVATE